LEVFSGVTPEERQQFLPALVKKLGPALVKAPVAEQKRILDLLSKAGITSQQIQSAQ